MGSLQMVGSEGIAKRLWKKLQNVRALALYSPFVVCLGSATLDPNSFIHCVSQDVYFLQSFARAYELAEEYADDDEDKDAIGKLRMRVLKRLRNQDKLISEWGFEPPKECSRDDATAKYTEFLMETASGKIVGEKFSVNIVTPFEKTKLAAYTLSVISPCMRLYSFISKEILALLDPKESNHVYKKWLDSLSSQKFEASASSIEDLLDKLSVSLTGEELDVVERLYHRAMKLELEFIWSLQVAQKTILPFSRLHKPNYAGQEGNLVIFCDFDLTCTAIDSSALLAELAILATADVCESEDLRSTWNGLFSQYVEEYQQCIDKILSVEAGIGEFNRGNGLNYEGLCKALEQISEVEKRATSRMVRSNVLKGLNRAEIKRAGEKLAFQEGCKRFFEDLKESKNPKMNVHVLSYCWSGDLIKSAFSSDEQIMLNVHSNDLVYEESISTGNMITNMESPMDKLRAFNDVAKPDTNNSKTSTVYIGGSVGDLLCLLEADIGIVIGSGTSLMKLGNHYGVSFVPLFSGLVSKQRELTEDGVFSTKGTSNILYTVSSWDEIYAFVLGQY
ncbi:Probable aminopyrimidine aminohydrolase-mitochondrial [Striga hermonthica]|uniref:Probable aminopyrimidine aminohydrolase-mitochondrial n=1 Tax=Striga hermonthica TaxID=68872 RepID=A0A9N7MNY8_STRHE|nr:Probable aminopyrimidine aminohydrolase-mitochondrial [Striga hermonthica]